MHVYKFTVSGRHQLSQLSPAFVHSATYAHARLGFTQQRGSLSNVIRLFPEGRPSRARTRVCQLLLVSTRALLPGRRAAAAVADQERSLCVVVELFRLCHLPQVPAQHTVQYTARSTAYIVRCETEPGVTGTAHSTVHGTQHGMHPPTCSCVRPCPGQARTTPQQTTTLTAAAAAGRRRQQGPAAAAAEAKVALAATAARQQQQQKQQQ